MAAKDWFFLIKNYLVLILSLLFIIIFLLDLAGANKNSPFYKFINRLASPFLYPFKDIFPARSIAGIKINFSLLFAFLVYLIISGLIGLIINSIFNLI